jgi:Fe2+ transport system protein FeoA
MFGFRREQEKEHTATRCEVPCCDVCAEPCALNRLPAGVRAVVVKILCPHGEASRLRILGLFEGTPVTIVDDRVGMVLDVRGTRVAIGASLAAAIIGIPVV